MEQSRPGIWIGRRKDMKRFSIVALTLVTVLSSVRANLGDGSDRVEELYGNLVQRQLRDDGTVSVLYHKGRYLYLVIFGNDRSISESYSHVDGTDLSEKEIEKFLSNRALPYKKYDSSDLPEVIAALLAEEKVIGLHQGRMEFGPRALGGRSIIGDARSAKMRRRFPQRKSRQSG